MGHGTKTTPIFLPADRETSWLGLLGTLSIRQRNVTRNHPFLFPQGDRSGLRMPKKDKHQQLITITTSVHLPKSVLNNLTVKSDSVLIKRIGKDGV